MYASQLMHSGAREKRECEGGQKWSMEFLVPSIDIAHA